MMADIKLKRNAKAYTLGGVRFETQKSVVDFISCTLREARLNLPLEGDAFNIVRDLINFHPAAEQRSGSALHG